MGLKQHTDHHVHFSAILPDHGLKFTKPLRLAAQPVCNPPPCSLIYPYFIHVNVIGDCTAYCSINIQHPPLSLAEAYQIGEA